MQVSGFLFNFALGLKMIVIYPQGARQTLRVITRGFFITPTHNNHYGCALVRLNRSLGEDIIFKPTGSAAVFLYLGASDIHWYGLKMMHLCRQLW